MTRVANAATGMADLLSEYRSARERALAGLGKVNVLIAGSAGVGKSTLINRVFGKEIAKTGVGRSVTRSVDLYEAADSPLRVYDTPGFEIRNSAETIAQVRQKIIALRQSLNPDDQIHVAWICILEGSHRVEAVHASFLEMLAEQNAPAIVVVTQALGDAKMLSAVKSLAVPNCGVVQVLAEAKSVGGRQIEPYGLSDLIDQTLRLLPDAQRAAFIAAQQARWDLKEKEAVRAINLAAAGAGAGAFIPWPGGHSAALATLQIGLMTRINAALGVSPSDTGGKDFLMGFIGVALAQFGGRTAFTLAFSEALKFLPGLGHAGAALIGGSIAAPITKIFGHAYLEAVRRYVRSDLPLPSPARLASEMTALLEQNGERYKLLTSRV
jgi:predicted GTPase